MYFWLFTFSDLYWVCLSVFSCTVLFASASQVIGCEDRLRNDLYCVEWGVKLYSNQTKPKPPPLSAREIRLVLTQRTTDEYETSHAHRYRRHTCAVRKAIDQFIMWQSSRVDTSPVNGTRPAFGLPSPRGADSHFVYRQRGSAWTARLSLTTSKCTECMSAVKRKGKGRVAHTRLPSVGFRSWSRSLAVSLQVTWVINMAVGCHYFPPGLQLPRNP